MLFLKVPYLYHLNFSILGSTYFLNKKHNPFKLIFIIAAVMLNQLTIVLEKGFPHFIIRIITEGKLLIICGLYMNLTTICLFYDKYFKIPLYVFRLC